MIASVIILSILLYLFILWGINKFICWRKQNKEFQLFEQQLQPGTILFREYKSEPTRIKYKVLRVKDGWCEYVLLSFSNFKNYTEFNRYDTIKYLYELGYRIEKI